MSTDAATEIFDAWAAGKSALVYGPPGTGKTRTLEEVLRILNASPVPVGQIGLDPSDSAHPFKSATKPSAQSSTNLPQPVIATWLTFHQSYSYEDFVVGLRPTANDGHIELRPHAGVLLDALGKLEDGSAGSIVLFIDEINRGNAAKIFGEFLTFLDFDYRATDSAGHDNSRKLPLPIRLLKHVDGAYEAMTSAEGVEIVLPFPSFFPRHLYVVATMNSVDRTAIPIDSALARRFYRIDLRPNLNILATKWNVELDSLEVKSASPDTLSAAECALLILDRLNFTISEDFGPDFELGHGLLLSVDLKADSGWVYLADAWDKILYPQLEDRYAGRPEDLMELLRVDEYATVPYAWRTRRSLAGSVSASALQPVRLTSLSPDLIRTSLQQLAARSSLE